MTLIRRSAFGRRITHHPRAFSHDRVATARRDLLLLSAVPDGDG